MALKPLEPAVYTAITTLVAMITIPYTYHPLIVDLIFDYSSPASLVVMASTCRAWRQRCLDRFRHVVDLRISADPLRAKLFLPVRCVDGNTATVGHQAVVLDRSQMGLLNGCRVLDVKAHPWLEPRWLPPSVDKVRYFSGMGGQPTLPSSVIVCQGEIHQMTKPNPSVRYLLIHVGGETGCSFYAAGYPDLSGLTGLQRLVMIFETQLSELEICSESQLLFSLRRSITMEPEDGVDDPRWTRATVWAMIHAALNLGADVVLVNAEN